MFQRKLFDDGDEDEEAASALLLKKEGAYGSWVGCDQGHAARDALVGATHPGTLVANAFSHHPEARTVPGVVDVPPLQCGSYTRIRSAIVWEPDARTCVSGGWWGGGGNTPGHYHVKCVQHVSFSRFRSRTRFGFLSSSQVLQEFGQRVAPIDGRMAK